MRRSLATEIGGISDEGNTNLDHEKEAVSTSKGFEEDDDFIDTSKKSKALKPQKVQKKSIKVIQCFFCLLTFFARI